MSMTTKAVSILKSRYSDKSMMLIGLTLTYVSLILLMVYVSDIPYTKDCSLSNISPDFTIQERQFCRGQLYPKQMKRIRT